MRRIARAVRIVLPLLPLASVVFLTDRPAQGVPVPGSFCGSYPNSRPTNYPGYGWVCAETGGTCSECSADFGGGFTTCVGDGDQSHCIDHQY